MPMYSLHGIEIIDGTPFDLGITKSRVLQIGSPSVLSAEGEVQDLGRASKAFLEILFATCG